MSVEPLLSGQILCVLLKRERVELRGYDSRMTWRGPRHNTGEHHGQYNADQDDFAHLTVPLTKMPTPIDAITKEKVAENHMTLNRFANIASLTPCVGGHRRRALCPTQQNWQLRDIRRDPPRFACNAALHHAQESMMHHEFLFSSVMGNLIARRLTVVNSKPNKKRD